MKIINSVKLDFDDVLLRPKRSDVCSREHVDITRTYRFRNSHQNWTGIPIVASNMYNTGSMEMAGSLGKLRCLTALHKFYSIEDLAQYFSKSEWATSSIYTLGATEDDYNKLGLVKSTMANITPGFICMDVANGYTMFFEKALERVRKLCPSSTIIAGNVATHEMVESLLLNGLADIIKIGIGPGSLCQTRKVTGVGYPQLSAIIECADAAHGLNGHIMADGGCKTPGDIVKAFAAGADFVMIGGMLMGTDECLGNWKYTSPKTSTYDRKHLYTIDDRTFLLNKDNLKLAIPDNIIPKDENIVSITPVQHKLSYRVDLNIYTIKNVNTGTKVSLECYGMSSHEAMEKHYGKIPTYKASEGVCKEVPYKGTAQQIMQEILGGLRSGCTYIGAKNLKELSKRATFVRIR